LQDRRIVGNKLKQVQRQRHDQLLRLGILDKRIWWDLAGGGVLPAHQHFDTAHP
jgi:hypothetical protein